jgi:flavin reductase (DIM6/NTAB) family NADH-FMN oxidoreductase RutF
MLSLEPNWLNEREMYKFLIGSIIPRPIAFVTTVSEAGTVNGAPFSYFNIVSANPPMVSISVQRAGGVQKDTARNAATKQEFVVHICDESNIAAINETSRALPPDVSEVEQVGLTPVQSVAVSVPGVKEAKIRFECKLVHSIALGEDSSPSCDLLIGRIVHLHIEEELYQEGKIDPLKLGPVSRLAGNSYANLGEIYDLVRPK